MFKQDGPDSSSSRLLAVHKTLIQLKDQYAFHIIKRLKSEINRHKSFEHSVFLINTKRDVMAVYCENNKKHTNTRCGYNEMFLRCC